MPARSAALAWATQGGDRGQGLRTRHRHSSGTEPTCYVMSGGALHVVGGSDSKRWCATEVGPVELVGAQGMLEQDPNSARAPYVGALDAFSPSFIQVLDRFLLNVLGYSLEAGFGRPGGIHGRWISIASEWWTRM